MSDVNMEEIFSPKIVSSWFQRERRGPWRMRQKVFPSPSCRRGERRVEGEEGLFCLKHRKGAWPSLSLSVSQSVYVEERRLCQYLKHECNAFKWDIYATSSECMLASVISVCMCAELCFMSRTAIRVSGVIVSGEMLCL